MRRLGQGNGFHPKADELAQCLHALPRRAPAGRERDAEARLGKPTFERCDHFRDQGFGECIDHDPDQARAPRRQRAGRQIGRVAESFGGSQNTPPQIGADSALPGQRA